MKNIRFKLLIISSLLGIVMGLFHNIGNSSSDIDNRVYAQAIMLYEGVDSVLEDADIIVKGTIESINAHSDYDEYVVAVSETLKGDIVDQVQIRNYLYEYSYSYGETEAAGRTNTDYEVGKNYIFVLQHIRNVYEDIYMILSDVHIPLNDAQECTVLAEELEDGEAYIDQYKFQNEQGRGSELSLDYIESSDPEVIFTESKYIAKVEIQELYRSTETVDVYSCTVVEFLKGDMQTLEDNQIIIPFFKDTVQVGDIYVVCLNSDREDAIIYSLSSKNSVWEPSQFEDSFNAIMR